MPVKTYNCSQQQLYIVSLHAWQHCQKQLPQFQLFSPRYQQAFINTQLQYIINTQALPDFQARNAASEILHIQLTQQATICLRNWQKLKRYIASAYPASMQKTKLQAAGLQHYRKASRKYWNQVQALVTSSSHFITQEYTQLTADKNMPPLFQTRFNTEKIKFQELHHSFLKSQEQSISTTAEKIIANNHIHKNLMSMLLDAQEIFRQQPVVRTQFTFEHIIRLITST